MHRSGSRKTKAWLVTAASVFSMAASIAPGWAQQPQAAVRESPFRDRRAFAAKFRLVRVDDSKRDVIRLLGRPDDHLSGRDVRFLDADEVWGYGTAGHRSLATLGSVQFKGGRVSGLVGDYSCLQKPVAVDEAVMRKALRLMEGGPSGSANHDPLHVIRVVNFLQPLGKEKALTIISELVRIGGPYNDSWLYTLFRTLFEVPNPPGHMPAVFMGWGSVTPPSDPRKFPRFPTLIVDNVPLSLYSQGAVGGHLGSATTEIRYFLEHGTMRSGLLRPPDDPFAIYAKALASPEWRALFAAGNNRTLVSDADDMVRLQIVALCRTAFSGTIFRQPYTMLNPAYFEKYHKAFLGKGARWDARLQMYVRRDGTHDTLGAVDAD